MTEMKLVGKGAILNAEDVRYAYVPVPEWAPEGTDPEEAYLKLKSMSGKDATGWEGKGMAYAVAKSAIDDSGVALFTLKEAEDLEEKSFAVLKRIQDAAMQLNGMVGDVPKTIIKNA
jgi:hypothetical protein